LLALMSAPFVRTSQMRPNHVALGTMRMRCQGAALKMEGSGRGTPAAAASASMLMQQLLALHRTAAASLAASDPDLAALTLAALALAQDLMARQERTCAGTYWRVGGAAAVDAHPVMDTAMTRGYVGPARPECGESVALCNRCGCCLQRDNKKRRKGE